MTIHQLDFAAQAVRLSEAAPGLLGRALRRGGIYADLFYEQSLHHQMALCRQVRETRWGRSRPRTERQYVEGCGLRVLGAAEYAYAATTDLSAAALRSLASDVAARVREGAAAAPVSSPAWAGPEELGLPKDAPDEIAVMEKAALLEEAADAAQGLDDRVARVEVRYHDRVRRVLIATSEGRLVTKGALLVGLRVEVTLKAGGRSVNGQAVAGGAFGFGHFFAHPAAEAARVAVEQARRRARARPIRRGRMPVVIAGSWGGAWLHEAVGHLLEADTAAHHAAPLVESLGEKVAENHVTLVDDATLPGGRATAAFDDEGTPCQRTVLVERGCLRSLLTDRIYTRRLGRPCTGNARRQDFRCPPLPRMSNLLLLPGEAAPEDLIAEVQDGLFVKTVGHGLFQPEAGRFSFEVLEGYRIEQGRLTAPVAGVRLAGETPEVLASIVGVGRDFGVDAARGMCDKAGQVVPVSVGMPTVLVAKMEVV